MVTLSEKTPTEKTPTERTLTEKTLLEKTLLELEHKERPCTSADIMMGHNTFGTCPLVLALGFSVILCVS